MKIIIYTENMELFYGNHPIAHHLDSKINIIP